MTIAVLGPGGVGGFLAAMLAQAGTSVVVVARESTARLIGHDGIRVSSVLLDDFVAHPQAVATLETPVDALFVATKATGLAAALERVRAEPALVVPLLNGLDHMAVLRERFGSRVAAGAIRIESDRPRPAHIVHTSRFLLVELSSDDTRLRPALEQLADVLRVAGVPARLGASEAQVLWHKLVRLNALACTTSAVDQPIGFIRSDSEWRATLEQCVREAAAVAAAEGASVPVETVMAELDDAHDTLGSSMQRDIAAGREPELDTIPGAVLRAAARHGLACPTIERLARGIAVRAGVAAPAAQA